MSAYVADENVKAGLAQIGLERRLDLGLIVRQEVRELLEVVQAVLEGLGAVALERLVEAVVRL